MKLSEAFDGVVAIAKGAKNVDAGMSDLLAYLAEGAGDFLKVVQSADVAADVETIRRQLITLVQSEPPPDDVDVLYFGLFDAVDQDGNEAIRYYVAGVHGYNSDDPETLCDPKWWPAERYLESETLCAVKAAELSAARGNEDARELIAYAGQLGVALLVSKFASIGVFSLNRCVVGFDSGDVAEIDVPAKSAG